MANQLLVEDEGFGQDNKGFVMLTADLNVRLRWCHKGKAAEDFIRLIQDNLTQGSPEAIASADVALSTQSSGANAVDPERTITSSSIPTRKLAEMTRNLRENLASVLDEREKLHEDRKKLSKIFTSFALDGDLDSGMKLMTFSAEIDGKEKVRDPMDSAVEETWALCQKLEKGELYMIQAHCGKNNFKCNNMCRFYVGMVKLMKIAETGPSALGAHDIQPKAAAATDNSAELDYLRRTQRKMKKELEEKAKEVELLRAQMAVK